MAEQKAPQAPVSGKTEVERLRAENAQLRAQLAAVAVAPRNVPAPKPYLTEGERQDLITFGVTTDVHSGQRLNLHQARERFPDAALTDVSVTAQAAADRDNQK